ncbi:helix-turn-helix domain-containing protein, partial [Thiolapillus sp.]|uniref:helix-turn-helix domain-containing protein n=1 Tax=Thiolapillus sp. TaxID=2017437 RepID=UPI003AF761D7
RVKCQEHGVKRVDVPWARKGSAFTLLFEQAALVREMSVNAAARIIEITDKRLWRIVEHYVGKAVSPFNLSDIEPVGLDEAASKRGATMRRSSSTRKSARSLLCLPRRVKASSP